MDLLLQFPNGACKTGSSLTGHDEPVETGVAFVLIQQADAFRLDGTDRISSVFAQDARIAMLSKACFEQDVRNSDGRALFFPYEYGAQLDRVRPRLGFAYHANQGGRRCRR